MVSNHLRGKMLAARFAVCREKPFAFPATGFFEFQLVFPGGMHSNWNWENAGLPLKTAFEQASFRGRTS